MSSGSPEASAREHRGRSRKALELAAERASELASERAGLEEIKAQLEADERAGANDVSAVNEECARLENRLAEAKRRVAELDLEIASAHDAAFALQHELDAARRRSDRTLDSARQLESEIDRNRDQISEARSSFRTVLEDIVRIKHKLYVATDSPRK